MVEDEHFDSEDACLVEKMVGTAHREYLLKSSSGGSKALISKIAVEKKCDRIFFWGGGTKEKTTLTSEQARAVIRIAAEPYRSLFWIIAETGCAAVKCAGCSLDVDLAQQFIHLKRSAWRAQLQTPKTGNAVRSFPISPALSEHLAVFIGERKGLLFSTRTGHPLDNYNVVAWALKPLLKQIGIADMKHMGLHAFRRCNASALDSLGAPMRVRMDRLGHAQQETTMGYSHSNIGDHRRIAAELGRVFCP